MLSLVNDILDLSKVEAGQLVIEKAPFHLSRLAEEVIALFTERAADKGIQLLLNLRPLETDDVLGDSTRLRQVLINLIGNSMKFTSQGTIELSIGPVAESAGQASGGNLIEFAVSDTGIGVPEDKLESIFNAFTQVDSSTTRKYGGTGLGLGICLRFVKAMGGNLTVTSALGVGSTFRFSLPLERAPIPLETPRVENENRQPRAAPLSHPLRILVAEDIIENQFVLESYLSEAGHALTFVDDGRQAVEKVAVDEFDLVLMDLRMPEMDGLTATRLIREREIQLGSSRLPIVALSADAGDGDVEESLEAGCDAHVTKPVSIRTLLEAVNKWGHSHQPRPGSADAPSNTPNEVVRLTPI